MKKSMTPLLFLLATLLILSSCNTPSYDNPETPPDTPNSSTQADTDNESADPSQSDTNTGDISEDNSAEGNTVPEGSTSDNDTPEGGTPESDTPESDTPESDTPESDTPENTTPEDVPSDNPPDDEVPEEQPSIDTPEQPKEDPDAALKGQLAGDWSMYLAYKESMCQDMYWMVDCVEDFLDNPSWETLSVAKSALSAAQLSLGSLSMPTYNVPIEQHAQLIANGYKISGMWEELHRLDSIRNSLLSSCDTLTSKLYSDIFFTPLFDCAKEHAECVRTSIDVEMELAACYTDEIMFSLQNEDLRQKFMIYLCENNPLIVKYLPVFSNDLAVIYQNTNRVMDKYEAAINYENTIYGKEKVAFDMLMDLLTNNREQLLASSVDFHDEGNMLPLPSFFMPSDTAIYCYHVDEEGNVSIAAPNSPAFTKPNRYQFGFLGVSEDDYVSYLFELEAMGIYCDDVKMTSIGYAAYYMMGQSSAIIEWENDMVSLTIMGDDLHLVPQYYYQIAAPENSY